MPQKKEREKKGGGDSSSEEDQKDQSSTPPIEYADTDAQREQPPTGRGFNFDEQMKSTKGCMHSLEQLRSQHEQMLNGLQQSKQLSQDEAENDSKYRAIELSKQRIESGLADAQFMIQCNAYIKQLESERRLLQAQVKRLCQENSWLREELNAAHQKSQENDQEKGPPDKTKSHDQGGAAFEDQQIASNHLQTGANGIDVGEMPDDASKNSIEASGSESKGKQTGFSDGLSKGKTSANSGSMIKGKESRLPGSASGEMETGLSGGLSKGKSSGISGSVIEGKESGAPGGASGEMETGLSGGLSKGKSSGMSGSISKGKESGVPGSAGGELETGLSDGLRKGKSSGISGSASKGKSIGISGGIGSKQSSSGAAQKSDGVEGASKALSNTSEAEATMAYDSEFTDEEEEEEGEGEDEEEGEGNSSSR